MSCTVMMVARHGHRAPARDIVPSPRRRSFSRFWAALPPFAGTLCSMPNTTPVRSALGSIVSSTRFRSFLHSYRVFRSGTVARQLLQVTVRAQR